MRWSEVTARPSPKTLRQFAGLLLIVVVALTGLRYWKGEVGPVTIAVAAAGIVVGLLGLARPEAIRYVYTGWMIAAFPIGWTISRVVVTALFYLVFTPFAFVFKLLGRDALNLKRHEPRSYWIQTKGDESAESYYGQF